MVRFYKKYKKEIEKLTDYDRGFYCSFWLGWIHCLAELGKITEEEGMELENFLMKKGKRGKKYEKIGGVKYDPRNNEDDTEIKN